MAKVVKMGGSAPKESESRPQPAAAATRRTDAAPTVEVFGQSVARTHVIGAGVVTALVVAGALWFTVGSGLLSISSGPDTDLTQPDISSPERPAGSEEDVAARKAVQERKANSDGNSYRD